MSNANKREVRPRQFPEEEGYRNERLVNSKNKRKRYITKLNKTINLVTELINQNADIKEIDKNNDLLEVIINKIRKLTTETIKDELHDDIKEHELNSCTNAEFKLIQARNYIESYMQTKLTVPKTSSLSLLLPNVTTCVKS